MRGLDQDQRGSKGGKSRERGEASGDEKRGTRGFHQGGSGNSLIGRSQLWATVYSR